MNYIHIKYFLNIISKKLLLACFLIPVLLKANTSDSTETVQGLLKNLYTNLNNQTLVLGKTSDWTSESLHYLTNFDYFKNSPIKILKSYFELITDHYLYFEPNNIGKVYEDLIRISEAEKLTEAHISSLISLYNARITAEELFFQPNSIWFQENFNYIKTIAITLNKSLFEKSDFFIIHTFFSCYFPKIDKEINMPSFDEFTRWNYAKRAYYLKQIQLAISKSPDGLTSYYSDWFNLIWTLSAKDSPTHSPFLQIH